MRMAGIQQELIDIFGQDLVDDAVSTDASILTADNTNPLYVVDRLLNYANQRLTNQQELERVRMAAETYRQELSMQTGIAKTGWIALAVLGVGYFALKGRRG